MINFGNEIDRLKEYVGDTVAESKKLNKKLLTTILKELKTDMNLKTQYVVYENIKSFTSDDVEEINEHISSNMSLIKNLNPKKLSESNSKLKGLIDTLTSNKAFTSDSTTINEAIHSLLITKNTPTNTKERTKAKKVIIESIKNNILAEDMSDKDYTDPKFLSSVLIERFNTKYADADSNTRQIFNNYINNDEDGNRAILKSMVSECVKLINEALKTEDQTKKEKLLSVKERLLETEYSKDTIISDVQRLNLLKESLK